MDTRPYVMNPLVHPRAELAEQKQARGRSCGERSQDELRVLERASQQSGQTRHGRKHEVRARQPKHRTGRQSMRGRKDAARCLPFQQSTQAEPYLSLPLRIRLPEGVAGRSPPRGVL